MKPFTKATVLFLAIITLVHLLRLFAGWEVIVQGMVIPVWWSAPAFVVVGLLAVMVMRESRH